MFSQWVQTNGDQGLVHFSEPENPVQNKESKRQIIGSKTKDRRVS